MQKKCYITTPIYYANGAPHIGTAYTSLIADIYARIKRTSGYMVKFATGTDENGQKMKQAATNEGKEVMEYLDDIAQSHLKTRDALQISYTDFIRTTHPTHQKHVQEILEEAHSTGDIYQGEYTGMYCLGCEGFKKDTDLIDHEGEKVCPDHLKKPESIQEKNRFFALSKYQEKLETFYKKNPDYVLPSHRYNEIKAFVENGLEDFSISREGSDFGIPMPKIYKGGESMVYIWFDALYNYLTVCKYPESFTHDGKAISGKNDDMSFWSGDCEIVHTLGKDISRFHAIYRPAMLMSSGNQAPITEIINGFFTVDGQKMSKSLGNKIDPLETLEEVGRDALVYYLFSDIKIGNDGDFSTVRLIETKENVLKKGRGNLVSRVCKLAKKYEISDTKMSLEEMNEMRNNVLKPIGKSNLSNTKTESKSIGLERLIFSQVGQKGTIEVYNDFLKDVNYQELMRSRFRCVQKANEFLSKEEPRILLKSEENKAKGILQIKYMLWYIKQVGLVSSPFFIDGFERLQHIMQIQHSLREERQTGVNKDNMNEDFVELLNLTDFKVEFGSGYIY